ncbi:MAG: choice-of-anchor D domain-containing protein [bacterium]|nr:choice-of-anchor D domain-containing protein [bacterium]
MSRWRCISIPLVALGLSSLLLIASLPATAAAAIIVEPDSLSADLPPDGVATASLLISNTGKTPLAWTAFLSMPGASLAGTRGAGFTYRDIPMERTDRPAGADNGDAAPPPFAKRIYSNDRQRSVGPRILLHATYHPENDAYSLALQRLGLSHTVVTNWASLAEALTEDGPWDLVVVNNYSLTASAAALAALSGHLDAGGRLIYADWSVAYHPNQDLLTRLGVFYRSSLTRPLDVVALDPRHRCFRLPNAVTGLSWSEDQLPVDGQIVTALAGAQRLAEFPDHPGSGAIVLSESRFAIFNAFQAANYRADDNDNGVPDMVELAENEIVLVAAGARWLSIAPEAGTLPAGGTQTVSVNFDAATLCGDERTALIVVESDDVAVPQVEIPVALHVSASPGIVAAPASFDFGLRPTGYAASASLLLSNDGCWPLTVASLATDQAEFTVTPAGPFTLAPGATQTVEVTYAPTESGVDLGTLTILSDDPLLPSLAVPLSGAAGSPPAIVVAPDSLAMSLHPGQVGTAALALGNSGELDLVWSAHVNAARAVAARTRGAVYAIDELPARSLAGLAGETNGVQPEAPWSGRRVYTGDRRAGYEPRILLLTSTSWWTDAFNLALQRLGFGFTMVSDWGELEAALAGDDPWDLVIVNNYYASTMVSGLDALVGHLDGGGTLIFADWAVYSYPHHELLTRLGVTYQSTFTTPLDFAATNPDHLCFRHPNTISALHWNQDQSTRDGQIVAVNPGALQLAAFDGYPGSGAVVLAASGRAVFNGFQGANFTADDDGDGVRDAVELAENEIMLVGFGPSWLSVAPDAGVLHGGDTVDLTVTFDATHLCGDDYAALIGLASNDPLAPEVTTPASLHVSEEPDITVTSADLDFGPVIIGAAATRTVNLVNDGCSELTITGVSADDGQFTSPTPFPATVPQNQSHPVEVIYRPTGVGLVDPVLKLTSDDPDEPVITLRMSGAGIPAPVISVAPDSLAAELVAGGESAQSLTIRNDGLSDLVWSARIGYDTPAAPAGPRDLSGVRVMWAAHHGQSLPDSWSRMVDDLALRGAEVVVNTAPVTPDLLDGFDIVWTVNCASGWSSSEIDLLADWLRDGGGMLLEGDNDTFQSAFDAILAAAGAGIGYSTSDAYAGTTTEITPHETTAGVTRLRLDSPQATLETVVEPAQILVRDANGLTVGAWSEVGRGRVIALSEELFRDADLGIDDNRRFGELVFDWLAADNWLRISPLTGVLPPGSAQELAVVFDATGRCGATLSARITVASNDPYAPAIAVPATLELLGEANLTVSPVALSFGTLYPGTTATDTLTLVNEGCVPLAIDALTSDDDAFTISPAGPVTLAPRGSLAVAVVYAPAAVGTHAATLTIASDDPDEPAFAVALAGACAEPPAITLTPTSLSAVLEPFVDELTLPLTIGNQGHSELVWSAVVADAAVTRRFTLPRLDASDAAAPGGELTGDLRDLTGVRIMWDRGHGQAAPADWTGMIHDLAHRGATVSANTAAITPSLLSGYDIFWSVNCTSYLTTDEKTALAAWAFIGGGILLEGDNNASIYPFNQILAAAGAGIDYNSTDARAGTTARVSEHATTVGIGSLFLPSPGAHLGRVVMPGRVLVLDTSGIRTGAWSRVGRGRVITLSDEMFGVNGLNADDNRLFGNQVFDWLAGAGPVQIEPESGVILPGEKLEAKVWFHAADILCDIYATHISLASNDPVTPAAILPVTFEIPGQQDIAVTPTAVVFAQQPVGIPAQATLTVANTGCRPLTVSAVTSDHVEFTVAPAGPFTLAPESAQEVLVTYLPTAQGTVTGALTIASDDLDESSVVIPFAGTAVPAPLIAVAPDTLAATLDPDGVDLRHLKIANTGRLDLHWSLSVAALDAAASAERAAPSVLLLPSEDTATDAFVQALQRLGWSYTAVLDYAGLRAQLVAGGPWDLVIVNNNQDDYGDSVIDDLVDHLDAGRALIFSDLRIGYERNHELLVRLGFSHLEFNSTPLDFAATDPDHRCFRMPNAVRQFRWDLDPSGFKAQIIAVHQGARPLASFQGPASSGAVVLNGTGRAIFNAFRTNIYTGDDDGDGRRDIAELAENEIVLVAGLAPWLSAQPTSGTIPPGQSQDVAVTIDATVTRDTTDRCSSAFAARIDVASDDPLTPVVPVGVTLALLGEPDITAGATDLAFGTQHIGGTATRPFTVTNDGCEPLTIDTLTSSHADFTVAPAGPITLAPGALQLVQVTYAPAVLGPVSGTLTIASNDRDEPVIVLPLSGTGLAPPAIAVTPDSLAVTLAPGETAAFPLSISNLGPGELFWSASAHLTASPVGKPADSALAYRELPAGPAEPAAVGDNGGAKTPAPFGLRITSGDGATRNAPRTLLLASYEPANDAFALALQRLGLGHTLATTWPDFLAAAANGGPWDLLIVSNYSQVTSYTALNALTAHLDAGGSLIYADWSVYLVANHGLLGRLGVSYQSTFNTPLDVAATDENHVCFQWPHAIRDLHWDANPLTRDGQFVATLPGARRLAAFRDHPDSGAIVLDASGRALFNAFQTADYTADDDGDGLRDAVELAQNEIALVGLRASWLSIAPQTGTVPSGGTQEVTATFDATGADAGEHHATIIFRSDDPAAPLVLIPATMTVTGTALAAAKHELETALGLQLTNRPNPFNPNTRLQFNLLQGGDTEVVIYDSRGVLVQRLRAGRLPAGPASLDWNGTDQRGRQVASGVYLYRLYQDGRQLGQSRKMVLVR